MPVIMPCAMRVGVSLEALFISHSNPEPFPLIGGDQHQQRRRKAHKCVCPKSSGPAVYAAL